MNFFNDAFDFVLDARLKLNSIFSHLERNAGTLRKLYIPVKLISQIFQIVRFSTGVFGAYLIHKHDRVSKLGRRLECGSCFSRCLQNQMT